MDFIADIPADIPFDLIPLALLDELRSSELRSSYHQEPLDYSISAISPEELSQYLTRYDGIPIHMDRVMNSWHVVYPNLIIIIYWCAEHNAYKVNEYSLTSTNLM